MTLSSPTLSKNIYILWYEYIISNYIITMIMYDAKKSQMIKILMINPIVSDKIVLIVDRKFKVEFLVII